MSGERHSVSITELDDVSNPLYVVGKTIHKVMGTFDGLSEGVSHQITEETLLDDAKRQRENLRELCLEFENIFGTEFSNLPLADKYNRISKFSQIGLHLERRTAQYSTPDRHIVSNTINKLTHIQLPHLVNTDKEAQISAANTQLQTQLGRALGILHTDETWITFLQRSEIDPCVDPTLRDWELFEMCKSNFDQFPVILGRKNPIYGIEIPGKEPQTIYYRNIMPDFYCHIPTSFPNIFATVQFEHTPILDTSRLPVQTIHPRDRFGISVKNMYLDDLLRQNRATPKISLMVPTEMFLSLGK